MTSAELAALLLNVELATVPEPHMLSPSKSATPVSNHAWKFLPEL